MALPHPLSQSTRILVFASPAQQAAARSAGAHIVGGEDLLPGLITNTLPAFNRCIATTEMLPVVMKVARILGPKGLMPNVKTGTLTEDVTAAVRSALLNVPFKIEKNAGLLNLSIAKVR